MNKQTAFLKQVLPSLIAFCLCSGVTLAASSVDITLDSKSPGATISSNFIGLSYEMSLVCPATNGEYFFNPANEPLIKTVPDTGDSKLAGWRQYGGTSTQ